MSVVATVQAPTAFSATFEGYVRHEGEGRFVACGWVRYGLLCERLGPWECTTAEAAIERLVQEAISAHGARSPSVWRDDGATEAAL